MVSLGGSAQLSWSSSDATTCNASGTWSGTRALSGSETTGVLGTPGERTYTLVCTGAGGSATASVDVSVRGSTTSDAFSFDAVSDAESGSDGFEGFSSVHHGRCSLIAGYPFL